MLADAPLVYPCFDHSVPSKVLVCETDFNNRRRWIILQRLTPQHSSKAPSFGGYMRAGTMKRRYSVASLAALGLLCFTASAQVPPGMVMTPMEPPPELKNAIALYDGVAPGSEGAKQKEKWSKVRDDYVARNVTNPTLTPFLPTKDKATGTAVIVAPGGGL